MYKIQSIAVGLIVLSSSASASFVGIEIREDKSVAAFSSIIDPLGEGVRTFNLYAKFNAIASSNVFSAAAVNTVLTVGQPNATAGWGIDKTAGNANARFYQNAFGSDTAPNDGLVGAFGELAFDTFVTLGVKRSNQGPGSGDTTSPDPDFAFNIGQDFITGGWFNSGGDNLQGAASDGTLTNLAGQTIPSNFNAAKGTYDVLLSQVTILGLDAGVRSGEGDPSNGNATTLWNSDIFHGEFTVFTQKQRGGAVPHTINFLPLSNSDPPIDPPIDPPVVPIPGALASALAMFGIIGVASNTRRRR